MSFKEELQQRKQIADSVGLNMFIASDLKKIEKFYDRSLEELDRIVDGKQELYFSPRKQNKHSLDLTVDSFAMNAGLS